MTRVAEQEHISQQSLSNHIKKIESEYGVSLFDRTGGLTLTYAGEKLYNYAVRMLSMYNDMQTELFDMTNTEQGTLRIGISYTRGSSFLPEILPSFCDENPFIKINIVENHTQMPEEYLLHGHIDLYIGTDMREHRDIAIVPLSKERLCLLVPKKIAERSDCNSGVHGFNNAPFLLLSKGNRIRNMFDEYLHSENLSVNVRLESENIETLFELACMGMGIAVYSEQFLRRHRDVLIGAEAPVVAIPLNGEFCETTLSIGYNKCKYLSLAARNFIRKATQSFGCSNKN